MNKNNLSILTLLLASVAFMSVAVFTAVGIVSEEFKVTIQAPATSTTTVAASGDPSAPLLQVAQDNAQAADKRTEAVNALAALKGGDIELGKSTFKRVCAACHKIGDEGAVYAPDLTEVASRLTREKIVESMVNPNAVVEEKYKTTMVMTLDGVVVTGLLTEKTDESVKIFDGKETKEVLVDDIEEQQTKDSSSMPEKQADAMAPGEFLGVVEYLSTLKKK